MLDQVQEEQADLEAEPDAGNDRLAANQQNAVPILYNLNISPAVRCVKIVARLIDLKLELRYEIFKEIDLNR